MCENCKVALNVTIITGLHVELLPRVGQSGTVCNTVSKLRAEWNIDAEKREGLHRTFLNCMKLDTRE